MDEPLAVRMKSFDESHLLPRLGKIYIQVHAWLTASVESTLKDVSTSWPLFEKPPATAC